ncbi:MAG: hypothetical protein HYU83_02795 [Chloroflexi bacterium]|nr:hypothetical protein [Chloroflexota bacterium]
MATKEDLASFQQEIRESIVTKQEFHNTMDAVVKKLDNIEHAFVSNLAAHDRFEERISRLENHVGINQPKINIANNF